MYVNYRYLPTLPRRYTCSAVAGFKCDFVEPENSTFGYLDPVGCEVKRLNKARQPTRGKKQGSCGSLV